jgi:hypothetical protein
MQASGLSVGPALRLPLPHHLPRRHRRLDRRVRRLSLSRSVSMIFSFGYCFDRLGVFCVCDGAGWR